MKSISRLLTVTVVLLLVAIPAAARPGRADLTLSLNGVVSYLADFANALTMRFRPEPQKLGMDTQPNGAAYGPVVRFQPGPRKLGMDIQPGGETIPGEEQGAEPAPAPGSTSGLDIEAVPNG